MFGKAFTTLQITLLSKDNNINYSNFSIFEFGVFIIFYILMAFHILFNDKKVITTVYGDNDKKSWPKTKTKTG